MALERSVIGRNIRLIRKSRGMTQRKLAEKLDMAYQHVSGWERAVRIPSTSNLAKIAGVLKVELPLLLIENEDDLIVQLPPYSGIMFRTKPAEPKGVPQVKGKSPEERAQKLFELHFKRSLKERIKDAISGKTERIVIELLTEIETLRDRIKELEKGGKNLPESEK